MKIVYKRRGQAIGYIKITKFAHKQVCFSYIYVEPKFRGKKIASKLLLRALLYCYDKTVHLLIDPTEGSSLNERQEKEWLERYGFIESDWSLRDCDHRFSMIHI